ncbi:MAG: hypothetical protein KatS3mg077_2457 [Candidatus Binatia bacterium]|nr:MAG: hypothetical protein KatS3mg077_2457 [Candidatus Binatia bacterium]
MLGFLVRRCAHAIGHDPSPEEFAAWANTFREEPWERPTFLFGRPITVAEAEVIMRHPGRAVRTRLGPLRGGEAQGDGAHTCERPGGQVIVLRPTQNLPTAQRK